MTISPISPSFVQRCQEDLNPDKLKKLESSAWRWSIASDRGIVPIFFLVIGLSAFVATGIFTPIYLPIAGMTVLSFLYPASKLHEKVSLIAKHQNSELDHFKTLAKYYAVLNATSTKQIVKDLKDRKVKVTPSDELVEKLKPILARHLFLEGSLLNISAQLKKKKGEAEKLKEEDAVINRDAITGTRRTIAELRKQMLDTRVKTAFVNAVLRRPTFAGNFADLGAFTSVTPEDRMLGRAFKDPTVEEFFTFNNKKIEPLTYEYVKGRDITLIAEHFLTAMTA